MSTALQEIAKATAYNPSTGELIRHQRKGIHLGYFAEKEDAYAAYLAEKARLHVTAPKGCGLEAARPFDPAKRRRKSKAMLNPKHEQVSA